MEEIPRQDLPRVAIWLVPRLQQRKEFQSQIVQLAERFGSPVFVPHVTIYSCRRTTQQQELTAMVSLAARCPAIRMHPVGLASKSCLTQALFVKFPRDPEILRFYQWFDASLPGLSRFKFEPHLSLLYQALTESQRATLMHEIIPDMSEVLFDELWAVAIPETLVAADDLDGWQTLLTCRLASARNLGTIDNAGGRQSVCVEPGDDNAA